MTTYDTVIDHLFSLGNNPKRKQDLEGTRKLAAALGNPQDKYPTVHIAGTNGKGSVACKIAEGLRLEGYRVGLYTSPHLFTYRERITVNQEMISEDEVVSGLQRLFELAPTSQFFELTTLLAFEHFAIKNVDIAVIETGLGGRLDMTNIINPLLSVITTIDFDHQEILGPTLEDIAREKGGIIKEKTPVLLGAKANLPILRKMAHTKEAPLYLVSEEENEEIAYKALEILHPHFPTSPLAKMKGITKRPYCRFQMIDERTIADVAHNPSAFSRLFTEVRNQFPGRKVALLLALSKDKPLEPLIPLFKEHVEEIALYTSEHERLKNPKELERGLISGGYHNVKVFEAASAAFKHLINGENNRLVTIAGSFYMMEETLASLITI
ncbi:bifunctional folylpolyglutamate synthase/dihydrofolate synthase [Simkania sp.]|uniref:bifunctional folylpolyglutamate synthase/dihydrofolate synthase n=1 Tax=Simkania sp. TaxID=34094 RepID=UPI003B523EB5